MDHVRSIRFNKGLGTGSSGPLGQGIVHSFEFSLHTVNADYPSSRRMRVQKIPELCAKLKGVVASKGFDIDVGIEQVIGIRHGLQPRLGNFL